MLKAVIFDLDGVLLDATEMHFQALNQAIKELAGPELVISRADHLSTYNGLPTTTKLAKLQELTTTTLDCLAIARRKQELTRLWVETVKPSNTQQRLLKWLVSAGYEVAVCSNAVGETVRSALTALELIGFFSFYLSNEDVKNPKPDPEIYQLAIQRLGYKPAEVIVVEDTELGQQAAKAAGAKVIKVAGVQDVTLELLKAKLEN